MTTINQPAQIVENTICYATHKVVFDKELYLGDVPFGIDYMKVMRENLTPNGTPAKHTEELSGMNNDGSWTIETTAAQRRVILANAHAAWYATAGNPNIDAIHNLKQALVQADYIESYDMIKDVRKDGTTLCISIDCDDFKEAIELDAYGNVLKGIV